MARLAGTLPRDRYFAADRFPLAIIAVNQESDNAGTLHAHEFHELVLVTGGSATHLTQQESWTVAAGEVFVVKGEQQHGYTDIRDLRLFNILFLPEFLAAMDAELRLLPGYHALFMLEPAGHGRRGFRGRLRLGPAELVQATGLVERLAAELQQRAAGFQAMARGLFLQLATLLSRSYDLAGRRPVRGDALRLATVLATMEAGGGPPASLDDLARRAGMSKRQFQRVFQAAMGQSPLAYQIALRLARAAAELRHGEVNITEAAQRAGFADSNYFARQFRAVLGMTPRHYARQFRGG